jgi:Fe-S-cluster containining protein
MNIHPGRFRPVRHRYLPFLIQLEALFDDMDRSYATAARRYGFQCHGCTDNCCLTRFYHHTLLEYLYLQEGLRSVEPAVRQAVRARALEADGQLSTASPGQPAPRVMCPLNRQSRCTLYDYRPMICRLHGIPYELHRLDAGVTTYPGCDAFFDQCRQHGRTDYTPFDRTPFYRRMALLEKALRANLAVTDKIKLTIAQMMAAITESHDEND